MIFGYHGVKGERGEGRGEGVADKCGRGQRVLIHSHSQGTVKETESIFF